MKRLAIAALIAFIPLLAAADTLPGRLDPPPPFPRILEQAPTIEQIAPGIGYADYQLVTSAGPLSIHIISIAPHRKDVHLESVVANDQLTSQGETVGSMALRTGAVAGINGDYYDIGASNTPMNIVVRNGRLVHPPRKRYALAISRDGTPQIDEFSFSGQAELPDRTVALDGVDVAPPPNGGFSFLTPAFGSVPPEQNVTLLSLELLSGQIPSQNFRVAAVADNTATQPPGYYLAIGPNAYGTIALPNTGDSIVVHADLDPIGLQNIATAIGGGPLILHDGNWYDDPDGPRGGEYEKRIPTSGAAIAPDGTLYLIEVDGRQPSESVGLMRREFSALMRGLGATEGMAFDGGGSSTIVARRIGDESAAMQNSPSDGIERKVGDALLVYSTAPSGPPVRLVVQPGNVRALSGATIPLRIVAVDAANHAVPPPAPLDAEFSPPEIGSFRDGRFTALAPGAGTIAVRSGALRGAVQIEVERTPARVSILPLRPNVARGGTLQLIGRAYDERGYPLALPPLLPWSATGASVDARGRFVAGSGNATVSLDIGGTSASTRVTVGSHAVSLPFAQSARFSTIPRGGDGSLQRDSACATCVQLAFTFAPGEHAAYASTDIVLPEDTIGLSFDVDDDGSDARVRVALHNAINEAILLDATTLDTPGWRHVEVRFPNGLAQPAHLVAIYTLPPKGMEMASGSITIRNVRAIVAGEP